MNRSINSSVRSHHDGALVRYRLTKMDEWPRHQVGGTFDVVADGSPHWSDGYYFTTGDDTGEVALFSGLRLYSNNDVLDAFVCVVVGSKQYNMRWSRRLRPRIDDLDVGPISVDIIEPLKVIRLVCGDNPYGIACDLTFSGTFPPYNEDRVQTIINGRLHSDRSNYDQCASVSGFITVAGRRIPVGDWTGVRDHSWGIGNQTGGPRPTSIAPDPTPAAARGLRQWCLFRLPDRAIFWQFHHSSHGEYTKFESQCIFADDDSRESFAYTSLAHTIEWECIDGHSVRRMKAAVISLVRPDGAIERYRIENLSRPVYLQGAGYHGGFDDGLGRGVYRGDLHDEGEIWDVTHPIDIGGVAPTTRVQPDHYAETWGRCTNLDDPEQTGTGHLECVILGPYPGFGS
jgi:hypothetical protein